MRLNLNQLHVFYLCVRLGGMNLAAQALYVSPPAVTQQIRKLESWLGFRLFERGTGEIRPTERGHALYEAVDPMFRNLGDLEAFVKDLMRGEEAELRLGTHHLPANYFIPGLISHVRSSHPRLAVCLELGTQEQLLEELAAKNLDVALIIGEAPDLPGCRALPLFDMELVLVTAADGEFGQLESIPIQDLNNIPLILQQKGTGALEAVQCFLRDNDVHPIILLDNLSSDVIKQFLVTMPSAALIGRFIIQKELDDGLFREIRIRESQPRYRFNLVYLESLCQPLKLKQFLAGVAGFRPNFPVITAS